jgi:Fe-S cluster biogenesis protein NfuA/nitrite reductase/ring-hydroxylating ferredoxin subunit
MDVRTAGERVEGLLDELRAGTDPRAVQVAEELVRTLVELYGAGLEHVVSIVADGDGGEAGGQLLGRLATDPLVASLLLVHDLHPLDVDTRIQQALDRVRPYLGSHAGGVEYRGVDDAGRVHLRLEGSCHGCPSSTVTVRLTIEQAVTEAAPETTGVEVEGLVEEEPAAPKLLQIGRHTPEPSTASPASTVDVDRDGWARLPGTRPEGALPQAVTLGGVPVLVCRVLGTLYAYRDACPRCGSSLAGGELSGEALCCPTCGAHYDVRLAGAGLDDPARHLDPLPLLVDDAGVRVAVGVGAPR